MSPFPQILFRYPNKTVAFSKRHYTQLGQCHLIIMIITEVIIIIIRMMITIMITTTAPIAIMIN